MVTWFGGALGRFRRSTQANTAIAFALASIPLIGAAGFAVDYSRAASFRTLVAAAADGAALAAAKSPETALGQRKQLAKRLFDQGVAGSKDGTITKFTVEETADKGIRITVDGTVNAIVVNLLGLSKLKDISVVAEAGAGGGMPMEVALVLDNTGSMVNDMTALKDAARNFTEAMFARAVNNNVKIAVVPFVAAVNPGTAALSQDHLDINAQSTWHSANIKWRWIASLPGCNPDPFYVPPAGGGGGGGGGGPGNGSGSDKKSDLGMLTRIGAAARELFGFGPAIADVTPNTKPPLSGATITQRPPYTAGNVSATVPTGFEFYWNCYLRNTDKISNFDLFKRIPGASWKGCVEARPEPYDVTDEPPAVGLPNTRFVPYFWPDEPDSDRWAGAEVFANDYMKDLGVPTGWDPNAFWEWERQGSLFKYNGTNPATIVEKGPDTKGPNRSCPDPILPLTTSKSAVLAKIDGLTHWYGGGTVASEGVMWGWRALSPEPPFTEGAAYGQTNKVIVLMSDGVNSLMNNVLYGPTTSEYTAYGFLNNGRLPWDFAKAETYLDDRQRLACANAKAKGIRIITILFREQSAKAKQLMQECASSGLDFYMAVDQTALKNAFVTIAASLGRLRIVK